jgi:hypothetical protein
LAIIAIVIGALGMILFAFVVFGAAFAAFGVFNPQRFAQERCTGDSTKFACTSSAVLTDVLSDSVALQFINGAGETVLLTGVSVEGSCGEVLSVTVDGVQLPVELAPNEEAVLEVGCREGSVREGSVFEDRFTIGYDVVGGVSGLSGLIEVVVKS